MQARFCESRASASVGPLISSQKIKRTLPSFLLSQGAVIIYDWDESGRDMGGGLEKVQYPKRVFKKFFILERGSEIFVSFKFPKIPGKGINLDQISACCTSIGILMRSFQHTI